MTRSTSDLLIQDTINCIYFPTTPEDNLEIIRESINKLIHKLSEGYIWHKEEFSVHVPLNSDKTDLPPHLTSISCIGDNIEDEWFIVYILLEISKEYPNLVIQVYDNDGDFLLIEAADFLPSWANPETTLNRVFIYQNYIHFIPSSIVDIESDLKVHEAIKVVCDMPEQTKSPEVHQAILKRIVNYPKIITENIHKAIVNLPLNIATLLTMKPSLISPLVNAYCSHDLIDAKACKDIKMDDSIPTQVQFTRCLYAMLIHSKLIKTLKSSKIYENNKKYELGLKITCGYEIIMKKLSGDVFASKEFHIFLRSLTQNGYFKGNIEGSQEYKNLLENAKEFFLSMECPINTQACSYISEVMQTQEFANLKEEVKNQSIPENLSEDSDDWLNIHPDQLNDILKSRYGRQNKFKPGDVINSHTITSELSDFLKQSSDFEGIEISKEDTEDKIEFHSELFVKSLKNMMNIISSGNNEENGTDDDDDFDYQDETLSEEDLDKVLKSKLNLDDKIGSQNSKQILLNLINSMKEEGGSSGPSSNILRTIGLKKTDILDSDDDIE